MATRLVTEIKCYGHRDAYVNDGILTASILSGETVLASKAIAASTITTGTFGQVITFTLDDAYEITTLASYTVKFAYAQETPVGDPATYGTVSIECRADDAFYEDDIYANLQYDDGGHDDNGSPWIGHVLVLEDGQSEETTVTVTDVPGPDPAPEYPAVYPDPANGSVIHNSNRYVAWDSGADSTTDEVFFGVPGSLVSLGTVAAGSGKTKQVPALLPSTEYAWYIRATNANGSTDGDIWVFTTSAADTTDVTVYEEYTPTTGQASDGDFHEKQWGQQFTPETTHDMAGVYFYLYRFAQEHLGNVTVSLYEVDSETGLPDGDAIATKVFDGSILAVKGWTKYKAIFDTPCTVNADQMYVVSIYAEDATAFSEVE